MHRRQLNPLDAHRALLTVMMLSAGPHHQCCRGEQHSFSSSRYLPSFTVTPDQTFCLSPHSLLKIRSGITPPHLLSKAAWPGQCVQAGCTLSWWDVLCKHTALPNQQSWALHWTPPLITIAAPIPPVSAPHSGDMVH